MMLRSASFLLLFLIVAARAALALSTDSRLLQLVPPQSRLISGMSSSAAQGATGSFLLIAKENKVDLDDFFALTGVDASRQLQSLVFATSAGSDGVENEHSLLASGQFNRDSIFRFGGKGVTRESYREVPVLVVPPFERERATLRELRWLAVLDEHTAIFGSVESVRRELDRWVERSAADPLLISRIRRLEGKDDSWCVLLAIDREGVAKRALGRLDPKLGDVAHDGGLVAFGIKFGKKIEVVVASDPFPGRHGSYDGAATGSQAAMHAFSFLPTEVAGSRVAVKVSRRKYEEWIEGTVPRDPLVAVR